MIQLGFSLAKTRHIWQVYSTAPVSTRLIYNTRYIYWNTCHAMLTSINADSRINHLQINANLNIGEGGKNYSQGKLDKLVKKAWHETSSVSVWCFKEIWQISVVASISSGDLQMNVRVRAKLWGDCSCHTFCMPLECDFSRYSPNWQLVCRLWLIKIEVQQVQVRLCTRESTSHQLYRNSSTTQFSTLQVATILVAMAPKILKLATWFVKKSP